MPEHGKVEITMSLTYDGRLRPAGWTTIAVGFALQVFGLGLDTAYHLANPHHSAPLWAHLPIYAGAVLVLAGVSRDARRRLSNSSFRLGFGGAIVEVFALAWSLVVRAEANSFFLPAVVGGIGGSVAFIALARSWWLESRERRTQAGLSS
jgi:hypothetical protein